MSNPADLPSDVVTLRRTGALPLFYEILTGGDTIPDRTAVQMADVYPLIPGVSFEWSLARGAADRLAQLSFHTIDIAPEEIRLGVGLASGHSTTPTLLEVPALAGLRPINEPEGEYESETTFASGTALGTMLEKILDRRQLYHPQEGATRVPMVRLAGLTVVEELPLFLAFFHLGSVARYNPDFLHAIRSSRYWPVAAGLRTHGLYTFLLLSWSFIRDRVIVASRH